MVKIDAKETRKALDNLQKIAVFMEKSRLADYVELMNRPLRLAWLNFMGGVFRGVGMVIGGGVVSVIIIYVTIRVLSTMLKHVGGLPWVGDQLEQFISWILQVVQNYKGKQ